MFLLQDRIKKWGPTMRARVDVGKGGLFIDLEIWRFPEIIPQINPNHQFNGIFPYKSSIIKGYPRNLHIWTDHDPHTLAPRFLVRLLRAEKEKEERDEAETDGGKTSPKGHTAIINV